MYKNLIAEMAKKSVSKRDVAVALGVHENTVANKIKKGKFSITDGFAIRKEFFPECELMYLFETE